MPFIRRNADGEIEAVSESPGEGFPEEVSVNDAALGGFVSKLQPPSPSIQSTDQGFVRVLEDLIQLLIDKGQIQLSELPQDATDKIQLRRQLRSQLQERILLSK